jgi:LPXTG-motif cell wall-anchored protein
MRVFKRLALIAGAILGLAAGTVSAQAPTTSTSTQTRQFEIVSVDGNKVVVKGEQGYREITVADDFRLSVDGRAVGVRELKAGMKGTATITTTTTSTPVTVTQVRDGVVMQKTGNSIVVRTADGIRMFSEGDAATRGVRILRDGQPLAFTDLNTGDHLTATIVTTHPPKVMTQQQVAASMSSTPGAALEAPRRMAAATPVAAPGAPPAPSAAPEAPSELPKTASPLPLIALVGAGSTLLGLTLTMLRRRRSA